MNRHCSRRWLTPSMSMSTDDSITRVGSSLPARALRNRSRSTRKDSSIKTRPNASIDSKCR
jgi:hypothetical protein